MGTYPSKGLPAVHDGAAAKLILSALHEKFLPILGGKEKATQLLKLSLNHRFCFAATGLVREGTVASGAHPEADEELLGLLAFQIGNTSFLDFTWGDIYSVYGLVDGLVRALRLSLLSHFCAPGEIYVEALVVRESGRGKGIGTSLLEALFEYGKRAGFQSITLQVIDTNPAARKLYERLGFRVVKNTKIWPVNELIGFPFQEVLLMRKDL